MLLHTCLMPLNSLRLYEMIRLTRGIHEAKTADFSLEALAPFMKHETYDAGDIVFEKGEKAKRMYVILEGTVELVEFQKEAGPGDVLGEIGLFSPGGERTATAVCKTDCDMQSVAYNTVMQLYFQNPQFGLLLLQIITRRLLSNIECLQDTTAQSYEVPKLHAVNSRSQSASGQAECRIFRPCGLHRRLTKPTERITIDIFLGGPCERLRYR